MVAWIIDLKLDEGRDDCGSITATWTEPDGSTFVFSTRHLCSEKEQAKFMLLAEAALLKWRSKASTEKTISAAMTATANKMGK